VDDDVDKILSYDTITEAIDRGLAAERLNLLETLAAVVAEDILTHDLAARVFVRIEKLDRGPGALGVEIVRDREMVTAVEEAASDVTPLFVYLDNAAVQSVSLSADIDRLEVGGQPVVLCVGPGALPAPQAGHPSAQWRIDLLAMEQNAWVLAARDPRCVVVATRTELDWAMKNGQMSVWAPSKLVLDATDGPTGHSGLELAHWLAGEFDAGHATPLG